MKARRGLTAYGRRRIASAVAPDCVLAAPPLRGGDFVGRLPNMHHCVEPWAR